MGRSPGMGAGRRRSEEVLCDAAISLRNKVDKNSAMKKIWRIQIYNSTNFRRGGGKEKHQAVSWPCSVTNSAGQTDHHEKPESFARSASSFRSCYLEAFRTRRALCFAASVKSPSVVSSVRSCRMHSCASNASIVPIWIPERRHRLRSSAASM